MKQRKKRMSVQKRVLMASSSVLMLVLTFFIIKYATGLSKPGNHAVAGSVDAVSDALYTPTATITPEETVQPTATTTPTPVPRAEFETEYAHMGQRNETHAYMDGVAYALRYPLYADEAAAAAVGQAAEAIRAEKMEALAKREGTKKQLLIDYEDGETVGLISVLFYIETEVDGVTETETVTWLYNKKKGEAEKVEALFADTAYVYLAECVNATEEKMEVSMEEETKASLEETLEKEQFTGTREEFPAYVLTAEGVKFYYTKKGECRSILVPYLEVHTYMAVTENGTVVAERIRKLDADKPMIALTFDDGPHYQQTPRLLEILEKNNARATFFVLGDRVLWGESNENALRLIYETGNEVASHTYSHSDLATLSEEKVQAEITKTREAIYSVIGEYPTLVRPPYGSYNDTVKRYAYAPLITWNLDSKDWYSRDTQKVVEQVLKEAGDGKIVLMHDIHYFTVDAAEILIPELIARGYQIVTVQEMFYYKGIALENGTVYHSSYN